MAMRDLSELFVGAGAEAGSRFESARGVVRGLRNRMHFTGKLLGGASVLAFFLLLFRARLVPRWLSSFGAGAALLQMASVARPLFGHEVIYPMLAPLGVAYATMFIWLLIKGFTQGMDRVADAPRAA